MLILISGVALWWAAHWFQYIAPEKRTALGDDRGRFVVVVGLLLSIVLMVIGYRAADGAFFWGRTPALVGINNLLMLLAVYLFAAAGMKTRVARKMRHPMLAGFKAWALAHLLVNGDVESFILFGGLLAWAVATVIKVNRSEPEWAPPAEAPVKKEIMALVGTVLVFGGIAMVHIWLGYNPFG